MKQRNWIILFLAIIKFALPFFVSNSSFELHRDEYLYYAQGQHLDFGYLENPPFIGLLAFISSIFGGNFFWIKFWPALFGTMTLLVTVKIVKEFGGNLFAQIIASLGILFSAYMRIHFLFQPNFLDIFFWTLSAYFLVRYCNTKNDRYFFLLSLSLALGWWGKYSVLFFIVAILLALLATKYRIVFSRKNFWLSILIGLLLILPNIFWQYLHRFPLMHHMDELRETQLRYINKVDFLKEQLLMLFPVVFVWIGGLLWLLKKQQYRVIAFTFLFTIVLIMLGSGKGYYTLGAYPMLLAAGGVWMERFTQKNYWLRYAFILLVIALSIPFIPLLLPIQNPAAMAAFNKKHEFEKLGILKWEDQQNHPLQQDFADMLGWKELTTKTENFFQHLPDSTKESTIVYCRNYGLAGGLSYYARSNFFRGRIISDNGSFLLWIPNDLRFKNLLFVGRKMPEKDDGVFQHFENVVVIDSCTNPLSRQYQYKIIFFQNASDTAGHLAQQGLNKMKAQFTR